MHHTNTNQNKVLVAIFISEKVKFRSKNITRDKEGHFIMLKEPTHQKNLTHLTVHTTKNRASKYMK